MTRFLKAPALEMNVVVNGAVRLVAEVLRHDPFIVLSKNRTVPGGFRQNLCDESTCIWGTFLRLRTTKVGGHSFLSSVIIPFQDICTMALRTELAIGYDDDMLPISAACTCCGEEMPQPAKGIRIPADIILWFSIRFLEHKGLKHPTSSKSDDEEIIPAEHDECRID